MWIKAHLAVAFTLAMASAALAAGAPSDSTPPRPPGDYEIAVAAVKAGNYARALPLLQKVVTAEPRLGYAAAGGIVGADLLPGRPLLDEIGADAGARRQCQRGPQQAQR